LLDSIGEQYLRLAKPDSAENFFIKAISFNKKLYSSYIGLIKTYHLIGKKNKIGKVFRDYLTIFPEDDKIRRYYINHLYISGDFSKTAKEIEKYASKYENDDSINKLLAKCYLNTNNYQKAMLLYRQILRQHPQNSNYLLSYAYCMEKLKKTDIALTILEKSRSYIKDEINIELTIGILYFKKKKYEPAINAFKKAIEIDENDFRAYEKIAKIYQIQGFKDFAKKFKLRGDELKKNA
jgi:tetratricopeptide (TPR) repeat protein